MIAMRSISGRSAVLRGGYASRRLRDRFESYSGAAAAGPEAFTPRAANSTASAPGAEASKPFAAYYL